MANTATTTKTSSRNLNLSALAEAMSVRFNSGLQEPYEKHQPVRQHAFTQLTAGMANWKEAISAEVNFPSRTEALAHADLICRVVEFFVGGRTSVAIHVEKDLTATVTLLNAGYYANIGS